MINKHVLLGVTGSIAAYKSADLVRRLREKGAIVRVAMTENAKRFITPLTLQAVSGHPVHEDLFDVHAEAAMGHIELARWADMVLIAPATADFMARLVNGHANDLLTTLCLATSAPIAIAPAMNQGMWKHTATQHNLQALKDRHIHFLGTAEGTQACGDVGPGRMLEPADIIEKLLPLFATGALSGLKVLITAGPTHEPIDPVRYITNGSSGKMGYALAIAAQEAGALVTLVTGPVSLPLPPQMDCIAVRTAQEMAEIVLKKIQDYAIFLSVAAVGDYRAKRVSTQKIHKSESEWQLLLEPNSDIVAEVAQLQPKPFIVGFAAETENVIEAARAKRQRKKMDMIIANQVGEGVGMNSDDNAVTVISADQMGYETLVTLPLTPKQQLARQLITLIANEFKSRIKS
jgi:phosphopantothenoylcysteine decarboxylase/phosphopantothenate--cysteine ligase